MNTIMIQATPLRNVAGRVDYITNPERQEHITATFSTVDDKSFWKDLSRHCREQAKHSTSKKACEGREFMIALANDLAEMDPAELAQLISDKMKNLTGTDNTVALHWNKSYTNYHAHVVTSENESLAEAKTSTPMTRNTYFDAEGKRSTKKACTDVDGELLPGCTLLKKGECKIEKIRFGSKVAKLQSKPFLEQLKSEMTNFQNDLLQEERFQMFNNDIHIPQQHIGKNKTAELERAIKEKNQLIRDYNRTVDLIRTTAMKLNDDEINQIEEEQIYEGRAIIKDNASEPSRWEEVIRSVLATFRRQLATLRSMIASERSSKLDNRLTDAKERRNPDRARNSRDEWQR